MKLKHLPIFLCLFSVPFAAAAYGDDLTATDIVKPDTTGYVKSVKLKDEYNTIFSVKFKKNKGYRVPKQDRIEKYALLEKHCSYVGFNLGFASYQIDNKMIEPLLKVNNSYVRDVNVKASGGYFVKDNVAVGLTLAYSFYDTRFDMSADIFDLLFNARDYDTSNAGSTYSVSFMVKNFVPLNKSQRIFITNTTGLSYTYSNYIGRNIYNEGEKVTKTTTISHKAALGISPGIMYFLSRGFAFEFAFNPISIYYKHSNSINNETEKGYTENYGLSFQFMPFNIQLGFSYYFGLDYVKHYKMTDQY